MLRNKLVRSNGSIIDSSVIISCEFTEEVNCGTNLAFGDVTSSELTVEIRSTEPILQGESLTYYMIEDGVEKRIGVFIAEKPTVASRTSIRFSAYDNISKTEKSFSGWLREHQNLFPMTPMDLVLHICSYCGVTYAGGAFPNQGIIVNAFYADNITGRQILSWIGALAGRFVRANADGKIEFANYAENTDVVVASKKGYVDPMNLLVTDTDGDVVVTSKDMVVTDDGEGNAIVTITGVNTLTAGGNVALFAGESIPYKQGTLSYETYQTDVVERVQIKHSEDDVGVIYPVTATGNCYTINQNMVLGACSLEDVTMVAEVLYEQLKSISYVPFAVTLPRTVRIRAGDIVVIHDNDGNAFAGYVMKMSVTAAGVTISSTGDKSYGSSAAVASEKFTNLTGKVLEISKSIDGLTIANRDLEGRFGTLELSVEEFKTTVGETFVSEDEFGRRREEILSTAFTQTADKFEMEFNNTKDTIMDEVGDALDKEREERTSYIRFEDGNITLGKSDSNLLLVIKNDRISFVRTDASKSEVAWFADDVLHVTEGEFTVQLGIGKFGFRPGVHGNLSFKKVVD